MVDREEFRKIVEEEERQEEKKKKRRSRFLGLVIFIVLILATVIAYNSFIDQSINKGFFRFFDFTDGDTELISEVDRNVTVLMGELFILHYEDVFSFSNYEDYEMKLLYSMFGGGNEKELLDNMQEYYSEWGLGYEECLQETAGIRWYSDEKSVSELMSELTGVELEIEEAYLIEVTSTFDKTVVVKSKFFIYKIEDKWHMLPYLSPLVEELEKI